MKLDVKQFRYLSAEDWRVLAAFELGSKNHEVVPTPLAIQLAALKTGTNGVNRSIGTLAKATLIAKAKNAKYDGYRLTYGGYDYLALHALTKQGAILEVGSTIGVGKESDIILVTSPASTGAGAGESVQAVLKIHRLGRTSFRTVANNRSYLGKRSHTSWQYLSRLSAQREVTAMRLLYEAGLRSPRPIGHSRHAVVMSLIPGTPLRAVPLTAFGDMRNQQEPHVASLYGKLMEIIASLAEHGVIHGDMNEFNIMLEGIDQGQTALVGIEDDNMEERTALDEQKDSEEANHPVFEQNPSRESENTDASTSDPLRELSMTPHVIDFPQVTSMSHPQASEYFQRDVDGVKAFFRKRYRFESHDPGPSFSDACSRLDTAAARNIKRLDVQMEAAGFDKKAAKQLLGYYAGAEVDFNDVEMNLNDVDLNSGYDEPRIVHQNHARTGNESRRKAVAGWSL